MRLRFGPHAGRLAEVVLLRDPAYVLRCMAERPDGVLTAIFHELICDFDRRPFKIPCRHCRATASVALAYAQFSGLVPVCDACSAAARQASARTLTEISTFGDGLMHVATTVPRKRRKHMVAIIRNLALCKGGPERVSERAVARFFGATPP